MFPSWWTRQFGETAALGYRLRLAFPQRWVRFHSLPESRRYPETAEQEQELIRRQAAVGREVLGTGPGRLLTPLWEFATIGTKSALAAFGDRKFECIETHRDDGDLEGFGADVDVSFHVSYWVTPVTWDPTEERELLLAIANDNATALWMNNRSGEVFAPYDGGMDVIATDPERRDALRTKFAAWLSPRPDGL